ncbi:hypothetical protein ACXR2U_14685, partial [Jatrophihabitans sp. YIM 134969]
PTRRPAADAPRPTAGKIDYTRRDRNRPAPAAASPPPAPPRPTPTPTPVASADNALDLSAPTSPPPRPAPPREAPAPAPAPGSGSGTSLDLGGPPTPAPQPPTPASSASSSLDLGGSPRPTSSGSSTASTSLDLGGGPPPAPPAPSPATSSTSLDLGGTPTPAPSSSSTSTSLDLGGGGDAGPTAPGGGQRRPAPPARPARHHVTRRTRRGASTLLDFSAPVVTLNRLQSGIGALTLDAVVGDEVGDLRIGAAYATTDGRTGTVELDAHRRHGPSDHRPVVWAQREGRFERIAIDLRQSPSLARLLVYGFSPSKAVVAWGGTMVVTTYGGDRVDAPITSPPSPAVLALLSVYNVDGEFVVRAEMDPVAGTVRDTCRAFGYDRITWLDDRTPVT